MLDGWKMYRHDGANWCLIFDWSWWQVERQNLLGPYITQDSDGLETVVLGLEFRIRNKHFKRGDMKIKCSATIATVYWKTNELSIEGERTHRAPVMESRETRPQGHTHAEHILGESLRECSNRSPNDLQSYQRFFLIYSLVDRPSKTFCYWNEN